MVISYCALRGAVFLFVLWALRGRFNGYSDIQTVVPYAMGFGLLQN